MASKIRKVIEVHPDSTATVTSRSKKVRVRRDPTGKLRPGDWCKVEGDKALPFEYPADNAPEVLVIVG